MPLSEHEQKMLDEMERQLFADDPRLARAFSPSRSPRRNGRRIAIGLGGVVLGLTAPDRDVERGAQVLREVLGEP